MTDLELLAADDPRLAPSGDVAVAASYLRDAMVDGDDPSRHRADVAARVGVHADIAHRTSRPGHLTGSALVVSADGTRTLLMLHAKLRRWFQPGGHADGDTNLAGVALREAQEETGIDDLRVAVPAIDVDVHVVAPPHEDAHEHLDTRFLVVAPVGAHEVANEESLALRWVTEAELDDLDPPIDDSTRRLVRRGLALAAGLSGA